MILYMTEDRIEEIRKKKIEQMKDEAGVNEQESQELENERQKEKNVTLKKHLTSGARKRLNTVKMSRPEFGESVENQLVSLIKSGRAQEKITEEKMKTLLSRLAEEQQDDYDIRGMR